MVCSGIWLPSRFLHASIDIYRSCFAIFRATICCAVVLACRSAKRGEQLMQELLAEGLHNGHKPSVEACALMASPTCLAPAQLSCLPPGDVCSVPIWCCRRRSRCWIWHP